MGATAADVRNQNWSKLTAQLAAYAFKRIRNRSWELAQELAQEAITQLFLDPSSWDPEREEIIRHLARRVRSLAANEYRRKRNTFEIAVDYTSEAAVDAAADTDGADDALDRMRLAQAFRGRLAARLAGDDTATALLAVMADDDGGRGTRVESVEAQAKALGCTLTQAREARRRLFYHSEKVKAELAAELDEQHENETDDEEVAQ